MKNSFKGSLKWSSLIAVITFVLAAIFSIVSSLILGGVSIASGMILVFIIVLIGVVFDAVGLAAAAAKETPFHSMAAQRVSGAREAILICRNAARFSSFCNDVIGDISGIVSGTASAIVVLQLLGIWGYAEDSMIHYLIAVIFTSIVAAITVGGKALGKTMAITHSTAIVLAVGKIFYQVNRRFYPKSQDSKFSKKKKT